MNRITSAEHDTESVEATTLDEIHMSHVSTETDSIMWKIDVEGAEQLVLDGAKKAIEDSRVRIVFLETVTERIRQLMISQGFCIQNYSPFDRCFSSICSNSNNTLWVRDLPFVQERVKLSEGIDVHGVKV